jgi:monoamine oxidase
MSTSHLRFDPLPTDDLFDFDLLYQYPGDLRRHAKGRKQWRIAVLGGGISGLIAAYELNQLSHDVVVFEASGRVGGRILTKHFSNGTHGELGAMRIPANHKCTLHYAKKFNLEIRRFVNRNNAGRYSLRHRLAQLSQWPQVARGYELDEVEVVDPLALYEQTMLKAMALLSSEDKWQMFSNELTSPRLQAYDDMTLRQWLSRWLSSEAIQYVGHATGMIKYEKAAFLEALIDYFGLFRVDQFELVGGMDALPNAVAKELGERIRLNACVQRVEINANQEVVIGYRLSETDVREESFDYAICALPPPILTKIRFSPPPPARQVEAWRGVSFASSSKTLLVCRERPWEFSEGIYGGGSFTDMPNQQTWYPSDNAKPTGTLEITGFTGDDPDPNSGSPIRVSSAPSAYLAANEEVSHSPGTMTAAYMWEAGSRRFAAMNDDERTEMALHCLRPHHPTVEQYVEEVVHHCWDSQTSPGEGAFAYFGPGEHQRFQSWLGSPYPEKTPRVYFAGEHLAVAHAWIQGAIQSGLVAARHIVEA